MSLVLWSILTIHVTILPETLLQETTRIKIPRFDSGTPEEWIMFLDIVQKSLLGQNITTGQPMYECMERVLKDDARAEVHRQFDYGKRQLFLYTSSLPMLILIKDDTNRGT